MANKQDPLIESLMALAVSTAPLIERARASGLFKPGSREAQASEIVITPDPVPAAPAAPAPDFTAEKAALQDIIVSQALRINALEAEVAAFKARKSKS
jgi:hypothetical protein